MGACCLPHLQQDTALSAALTYTPPRKQMVWFWAELVTGLLYTRCALGAVTVMQQQRFWPSLWLGLASALVFSGNNVAALKGIFCLLGEKPVTLQRCFVGTPEQQECCSLPVLKPHGATQGDRAF